MDQALSREPVVENAKHEVPRHLSGTDVTAPFVVTTALNDAAGREGR